MARYTQSDSSRKTQHTHTVRLLLLLMGVCQNAALAQDRPTAASGYLPSGTQWSSAGNIAAGGETMGGMAFDSGPQTSFSVSGHSNASTPAFDQQTSVGHSTSVLAGRSDFAPEKTANNTRQNSGVAATAASLQRQNESTAATTNPIRLTGLLQPAPSGNWIQPLLSRNGLQQKGTWSLRAEAVFADFDESTQSIGSPDAPQTIGPFSAMNLGAIDGTAVGPASLVPSLIGQRIENDDPLGWRAALEYRGPQDGGFELEGMMLGSADRSWSRGVGGFNAGADPTTVRVTAALPLDDGGAGFILPFDQLFSVSMSTEVDSISAMIAPGGWYSGTIRFQPSVGFRYLRVNENLRFAGAGSGLNWTANADGTPDPGAATTVVTPPYQAQLDAAVETNFYGPAIGLKATSSGQLVRFHGLVRLGALIGDEQISVRGRGFGIPGTPGYDPLTRFGDSQSGTDGTLMFESQLGVDLHIFKLLHRLRDSQAGSDLIVRLGWSFLYLDDVARVDQAVRWNGFPESPTARKRSSDFTVDAFNVGVILQY